MSSRGSAVIEVAAGLPEVLSCPWVAEHAVEFESLDGRQYVSLIQPPGDQTNLIELVAGHDHGTVHLDDVNWFDDAALLAAAPDASWQAYIGLHTEQSGLWLAYTPVTGLVEGSHLDHDVMIPVEWANPATRTGAQEAQLARIATRPRSPGRTRNRRPTPDPGQRDHGPHQRVRGAGIPDPAPHPTGAAAHHPCTDATPHPDRRTEASMSTAMVEPISAMLARWWAATQAGDDTGAALIVGLWRADVIAAAGNRPQR